MIHYFSVWYRIYFSIGDVSVRQIVQINRRHALGPNLSHFGNLRSPSLLGVTPPRVPLRVFAREEVSLSSLPSSGSLSKSGGTGKSSIAERIDESNGAGTSGSS